MLFALKTTHKIEAFTLFKKKKKLNQTQIKALILNSIVDKEKIVKFLMIY